MTVTECAPCCAVCSTPLTGRRKVVCSYECRVKRMVDSDAYKRAQANRQPSYQLRCRVCGADFRSSKATVKSCSISCQNWIRGFPTHCAVPAKHPSRVNPPVSLRHPTRGHWQPVPWASCTWCERAFVKPLGTRHLTAMCCSKRCIRKRSKAARRAREHGAEGSYTWGHVMRAYIAQGKRCAYCLEPVDGLPDPEHVVPLSRGGSNRPGNVVAACRVCNSAKGSMLLAEWQAKRQASGLPASPGVALFLIA